MPSDPMHTLATVRFWLVVAPLSALFWLIAYEGIWFLTWLIPLIAGAL